MDKKVHLTEQRKAVYEVIQHATDHPTAADIIERLREDGQKISYATVYNSLRYLTDSGLIQELKIGDTVSRYDARMEAHHHIVCQVCGRVDELMTPVPQDYPVRVTKDTHYTFEDIQIVVKGVCPDCQRKAQ